MHTPLLEIKYTPTFQRIQWARSPPSPRAGIILPYSLR